jgi:hypothetical protein
MEENALTRLDRVRKRPLLTLAKYPLQKLIAQPMPTASGRSPMIYVSRVRPGRK